VKAAALLAVDAGGSKTDAVFVSRSGRILGTARAGSNGSSNLIAAAGEDHLGAVGVAIERAATEAALDPAARPLAQLGVFCLAGADLPADDRRLTRWLRANRWASDDVLRNDTFAVLRAGTDRPWGVAVVCGQGTNCAAIAPNGRMYRLPAVGPISGDWGGGLEIGGAALWHAIRAEDGRGRKTTLASLVPTHFGLRRPRQVMEAMYFARISEERVTELAPLVFRAAADGDTVAADIVERQADEVVTMATTAIRRLRMTKLDVDVVLGGGIFRNRYAGFYDRIEAGVTAVTPSARIHVLDAPPVLGASLIGLDRLGTSPAAHRQLRQDLTHERLIAKTAARRKER
jgi:N-acetylglucosamine kinase-like BadF-type ATPase